MRLALINPNIVTQKDDYFETGIPFMPMTLAALAGHLRAQGHDLEVIDSFGANPFQVRNRGDYFIQGLTIPQILEAIPSKVDVIFVYASLMVSHDSILHIIKAAKKQYDVPVIVIENSQSVNSFSLREDADDLFNAGADYLVSGEPEERVQELLERLAKKQPCEDINGIVTLQNKETMTKITKIDVIKDLDALPLPAWDLFPLHNYWKLKYAHGPLTSKKYMSILTSRGCPYGCKFCIVPDTNKRRWRFQSPKKVVDEIEHWVKTFGVKEFHVQDLNPTIRKERMVEISKEILKRKLDITWKFVAGTKIETMDDHTIQWMAKAGVKYISVSPESGSPHVLKLMDKPFDHEYALARVRTMHKLGIRSQACFVLGFPGEGPADRKLTKKFVKELTKAGIDEVALFIMTPVPGSATWHMDIKGFKNKTELTFSPKWRKDYPSLFKYRWNLYATFFWNKLVHHPFKLLAQPFRFLTGDFQTKMEMTPYRFLKVWLLHKKAMLFKRS